MTKPTDNELFTSILGLVKVNCFYSYEEEAQVAVFVDCPPLETCCGCGRFAHEALTDLYEAAWEVYRQQENRAMFKDAVWNCTPEAQYD